MIFPRSADVRTSTCAISYLARALITFFGTVNMCFIYVKDTVGYILFVLVTKASKGVKKILLNFMAPTSAVPSSMWPNPVNPVDLSKYV